MKDFYESEVVASAREVQYTCRCIIASMVIPGRVIPQFLRLARKSLYFEAYVFSQATRVAGVKWVSRLHKMLWTLITKRHQPISLDEKGRMSRESYLSLWLLAFHRDQTGTMSLWGSRYFYQLGGSGNRSSRSYAVEARTLYIQVGCRNDREIFHSFRQCETKLRLVRYNVVLKSILSNTDDGA